MDVKIRLFNAEFKEDVNTKCLYLLPLPDTSYDKFLAMDNWLWDNIGEEEIDFEWAVPASHIFFAREEDKVKFILKWL